MHSYEYLVSFVKDEIARTQPNLVAPLLLAIAALESRESVADETLKFILDAAQDKRPSVYEVATAVLGGLAETDERALNAIQSMSRSRTAHIRHNAVLCLTECTPVKACVEVLRSSLIDKSVRVRRKAADCIGRLKLVSLLPALAHATTIETDPETRDLLIYESDILRNGYFIRPAVDGVAFITTNTSKGGRISFGIEYDELKKRDISAIISEFFSGKGSGR